MLSRQDLLQLKEHANYLNKDYPLVDIKDNILEEIYPFPNGTPMFSRADSCDRNTILAINEGYEYGLIPEEPQCSGSIIDVGSYVGGFIRQAIKSKQNRTIIAIEPMLSNVALVQRNARAIANKNDNLYLFNVAVGDSGHISIKPFDESNTNPHRYMGNKVPDGESNERVTCLSLEELLILNELCCQTKQIFFMKIDCEGGEYPFFENATTDQIRNIKYIIGEFHKSSVEIPDYMFLKHGFERLNETSHPEAGLFAYKRID
jgi:FkbM family methyltransferase